MPLGYAACEDGQLEVGVERIALYAKNAQPKQAARQLPAGKWVCELGPGPDIEHTLDGSQGDVYGVVTPFLRREAPQ